MKEKLDKYRKVLQRITSVDRPMSTAWFVNIAQGALKEVEDGRTI